MVVTALPVLLFVPAASAQKFTLAALRAFSELTPDRWNAVDSGKVVAEVLHTQQKRGIEMVGVARLRATTACFVSQFQNIESFGPKPVASVTHASLDTQPGQAVIASRQLYASLRGRLQTGMRNNLTRVAQKVESSCPPEPNALDGAR